MHLNDCLPENGWECNVDDGDDNTHTFFLTEIYIPSIEIEVQNIKKVEVRYNTKYFLALIK